MAGSRQALSLGRQLRVLHPDPQAIGSETLGLLWTFETPNPPCDTSPTRPHLHQQGHTSTIKGHTFKYEPIGAIFVQTSTKGKDTFLIPNKNRAWGSGIVAEILGNIVSYLLTWPSLSLSSHMVMFWASHLWLMLRNVERHESRELPPVHD